MKKGLSVLLALLLTFTLCIGLGCSGSNGDDDSGKTVIEVFHYNGGVGHAWCDGAESRFEALRPDVDVQFTQYDNGGGFDNISTDGYSVYIVAAASKLRNFIQNGYLADITDVVTESNTDGKTIESKLATSSRELKGGDDKYYALPHYEIYDGITYDVDVFTEKNFFLAAPDATDVEDVNGVKFVKSATTKKSCGADGKYGTSDDGLPTTLEEFIMLCQRINNSSGYKPFYVCGQPTDYPNYLSLGLWTSLAGVDEMKVNFSMDGKIDKVTGKKSNTMFGYNYIYEPEVTRDYQITAEKRNEVYDTEARYYSTAFMELCVKNGWIEYTSENTTHTEAEYTFMNNNSSKNIYAMFIEGSYWFAQADGEGYYDDYLTSNADKTDRNISWMPLPTAISKADAVTSEENARVVAQLEFGGSYAFINGNELTAGNPAKLEASKAFLKFLYTDDELSAFTRDTGSAKCLKYDMKEEDYNAMATYQKGVWDVRKTGGVVYQTADNDYFIENMGNLKLGNAHDILTSVWGATKDTSYKTIFEAFKSNRPDVNTWNVFEHSSLVYKNS